MPCIACVYMKHTVASRNYPDCRMPFYPPFVIKTQEDMEVMAASATKRSLGPAKHGPLMEAGTWGCEPPALHDVFGTVPEHFYLIVSESTLTQYSSACLRTRATRCL